MIKKKYYNFLNSYKKNIIKNNKFFFLNYFYDINLKKIEN
jgi:hypothetical protein